jgi:hypothetical protein
MNKYLQHLSWKLKKLSAMGPREMLFRIQRKIAQSGERLAYQTGRYQWSETVWRRRLCPGMSGIATEDDLSILWHRHMQERTEPPFLLSAASLKESAVLCHRLFSDRLEKLLDQANRLRQGEFSFLGIHFQTKEPIAWQSDPVSGRSWSEIFYADVAIPYCDGTGSAGAPGDVKHVWELNRHEFLIDCAKSFYLSSQGLFAEYVFKTIDSWIHGNPYLQGVNWAGPLEVAVRAMSWLWAYQFCRHWQGLSPQQHLRMVQEFYRHGYYLYRHLEIYSSPNNHLVGEATALYLLGCFFPEFNESAAWRQMGWDVICREPDRQFFDDGGSTEQAISYHHYCLGFFLLAALTRQLRNEEVPHRLLQRLQSALQFSMWMTTPDGTVPRIGDSDDARSIRFGPVTAWDFRNFLCLGAIIFRRSDMKAVAGSFSEDALWLLGREGYEIYRQLPAQTPAETTRIFPSSGYAVIRSGWNADDHHLCFDCGPLGAPLRTDDVPMHTHGHADMLSFTLSAFGKPLLVDSGFYTFNGSPDWHRYCRDVLGHNTIRVDGASQAKFNVSNHWSCVAPPGRLLHSITKDVEWVEGDHGSFFGLSTQVRHQRIISWIRKKHWLIIDRLEGQGEHFIEVFFHFAPGRAEKLPGGDGVIIDTEGQIHAILSLLNTDGMALELTSGGTNPDKGWIATSYGCRQQAPIAKFYGKLRLPASLTYILMPSCDKFESLSAAQSLWDKIRPAPIDKLNAFPVDFEALAKTLGFSEDNQQEIKELVGK